MSRLVLGQQPRAGLVVKAIYRATLVSVEMLAVTAERDEVGRLTTTVGHCLAGGWHRTGVTVANLEPRAGASGCLKMRTPPLTRATAPCRSRLRGAAGLLRRFQRHVASPDFQPNARAAGAGAAELKRPFGGL